MKKIRSKLNRRDNKNSKVTPFKVHAQRMGIRPELNYDKISELIEIIENPDHDFSRFSGLSTTNPLEEKLN